MILYNMIYRKVASLEQPFSCILFVALWLQIPHNTKIKIECALFCKNICILCQHYKHNIHA